MPLLLAGDLSPDMVFPWRNLPETHNTIQGEEGYH